MYDSFYTVSLYFPKIPVWLLPQLARLAVHRDQPIWEHEQENKTHMKSPKSFNRDSQGWFPAPSLPSYPWQTNPHQESPIYVGNGTEPTSTERLQKQFLQQKAQQVSENHRSPKVHYPLQQRREKKSGIAPNKCLLPINNNVHFQVLIYPGIHRYMLG